MVRIEQLKDRPHFLEAPASVMHGGGRRRMRLRERTTSLAEFPAREAA